MPTLLGVEIVESPHLPLEYPKFKLSNAVQVTEKFRTEYNHWLADFFGMQYLVLDVSNGGKRIYAINPELVAMIRASNSFAPFRA